MKFLGIRVESRGKYNGVDDWIQFPAHTYCPCAETVDQLMECLHYEPLDAVDWECRFGYADHCLWGGE